MSDQRVVGFGLLKSCLMALAKTLALPLPSFRNIAVIEVGNSVHTRRKKGKNKLFFENHVACEGDWIALDGLDIDTSAAVIENLKAIRKQ